MYMPDAPSRSANSSFINTSGVRSPRPASSQPARLGAMLCPASWMIFPCGTGNLSIPSGVPTSNGPIRSHSAAVIQMIPLSGSVKAGAGSSPSTILT